MMASNISEPKDALENQLEVKEELIKSMEELLAASQIIAAMDHENMPNNESNVACDGSSFENIQGDKTCNSKGKKHPELLRAQKLAKKLLKLLYIFACKNEQSSIFTEHDRQFLKEFREKYLNSRNECLKDGKKIYRFLQAVKNTPSANTTDMGVTSTRVPANPTFQFAIYREIKKEVCDMEMSENNMSQSLTSQNAFKRKVTEPDIVNNRRSKQLKIDNFFLRPVINTPSAKTSDLGPISVPCPTISTPQNNTSIENQKEKECHRKMAENEMLQSLASQNGPNSHKRNNSICMDSSILESDLSVESGTPVKQTKKTQKKGAPNGSGAKNPKQSSSLQILDGEVNVVDCTPSKETKQTRNKEAANTSGANKRKQNISSPILDSEMNVDVSTLVKEPKTAQKKKVTNRSEANRQNKNISPQILDKEVDVDDFTPVKETKRACKKRAANSSEANKRNKNIFSQILDKEIDVDDFTPVKETKSDRKKETANSSEANKRNKNISSKILNKEIDVADCTPVKQSKKKRNNLKKKKRAVKRSGANTSVPQPQQNISTQILDEGINVATTKTSLSKKKQTLASSRNELLEIFNVDSAGSASMSKTNFSTEHCTSDAGVSNICDNKVVMSKNFDYCVNIKVNVAELDQELGYNNEPIGAICMSGKSNKMPPDSNLSLKPLGDLTEENSDHEFQLNDLCINMSSVASNAFSNQVMDSDFSDTGANKLVPASKLNTSVPRLDENNTEQPLASRQNELLEILDTVTIPRHAPHSSCALINTIKKFSLPPVMRKIPDVEDVDMSNVNPSGNGTTKSCIRGEGNTMSLKCNPSQKTENLCEENFGNQLQLKDPHTNKSVVTSNCDLNHMRDFDLDQSLVLNVDDIKNKSCTNARLNESLLDEFLLSNSNTIQKQVCEIAQKKKQMVQEKEASGKIADFEKWLISHRRIVEVLNGIEKVEIADKCWKRHLKTLTSAFCNPLHFPDRYAVVFEVISYVEASGSKSLNQDNFKSFPDEECIVQALISLQNKKRVMFGELINFTAKVLHQVIVSKKKYGMGVSASLCRILARIYKHTGDKSSMLYLCCDLLKRKHRLAAFLITCMVGIWRELLQVPEQLSVEELVAIKAIKYGVGKRSRKISRAIFGMCQKFWDEYSASPTFTDNEREIASLIEEIELQVTKKDFSSSAQFLLSSALLILVTFDNSGVAKYQILVNHIIPKMCKYSSTEANEQAFDVYCDLYVDLISFNGDSRVWKAGNDKFLRRFFQCSSSCIQFSATTALIRILLRKGEYLPDDLSQWLQQNCKNPKLQSVLQQRLIATSFKIKMCDIRCIEDVL